MLFSFVYYNPPHLPPFNFQEAKNLQVPRENWVHPLQLKVLPVKGCFLLLPPAACSFGSTLVWLLHPSIMTACLVCLSGSPPYITLSR
mmetsp:Transcript_25760/g.40956  ORF Transcript_25760/g.40956 Transcript_25760/m.40956 type:complete len:88 (-) Transcript_25760:351-614(-)